MSYLKLKISGKKPVVYQGNDSLTVPQGRLLRVIDGPHDAIGDIVIRTDEEDHPFVTLGSKPENSSGIGILWGTGLSAYSFEELEYEFIEVDYDTIK